MSKHLLLLLITLLFGSGAPGSHAEQGLSNCRAQFPGGSTSNRPAYIVPLPASSNNVQICKWSGQTSFFALEYDPKKYAPIWVSYRIADSFGEGGCASMTRREMACHFQAQDIETCSNDRNVSANDPFHVDPVLTALGVGRLNVTAFSSTGHDRGHMAPNSTFSWHACGAYKTFTMANMVPQWASHNQQIWMNLEAQILYWGMNHGPIYVATGPIWKQFPLDRFNAIKEGLVGTSSIPKSGERLTKLNGQPLSRDIPRPTGFYKVVFRPGEGEDPDRAIAFLVPHTKERGLPFWYFVSTIVLVQETTGLRFGFAEDVKGWPDLSYWRAPTRKVPSGWNPRRDCTTRLPVAGWMDNRPVSERVANCRSSDPVN